MLAKSKENTEVMLRNAPIDMLPAFMQALTLGQGAATEITIFCDSLPYGGLLLRGNRILASYQPITNHVFDQRSMRSMLRDFLTLSDRYTFMAWHNVEHTAHLMPIDTVASALMACALPRELDGRAVDLSEDVVEEPPEVVTSATHSELQTLPPTPPPVALVVEPPQPPPIAARPSAFRQRLRTAAALLTAATAGAVVHHACLAYNILGGTITAATLAIALGLFLASWVLQ